jgi:hypothetical protein
MAAPRLPDSIPLLSAQGRYRRKSLLLATSQNLQRRGLENRKKIWGDAEVDVEVAGGYRSCIAGALSTDFRSECHLDEFLLQSGFGVFQRYRSLPVIEGSRDVGFPPIRWLRRTRAANSAVWW